MSHTFRDQVSSVPSFVSRLPRPALMLVTDGRRGTQPGCEGEAWLDDVVRNAVLGGVNMVQLREKHLATDELVMLGRRLRAAIDGRALFVVNGDLDAARMLDADAIHLPSDGAAIAAVRAEAGSAMLISRAAHSANEAARAEDEGADFVVLGTVFETRSKPGIAPLGLATVRETRARVCIPVLAIGGIDESNAGEVLGAGAAGVAVIGAVLDAADARAAASRLRAAIEGVSADEPSARAGQ